MASRQTDVFLSYSHNDRDAALSLCGQIERLGLSVFFDKEHVDSGEHWLSKLQTGLERCKQFVVLVGRDGVRRWVGAETEVALMRHFSAQNDASRLAICPILLPGVEMDTLPPFLRLFQSAAWNGTDIIASAVLDQILRGVASDRSVRDDGLEQQPFVGLSPYGLHQAHLFFGRQKDTLEALACFTKPTHGRAVRWVEINGNSGSGKSSLMNAGILPLVDQGWLWTRTGHDRWRRIGPMIPGERPVEMLAAHLARVFHENMGEIYRELRSGEPAALRYWLRGRDTGPCLLAIDQFEELFTFAEPAERELFDQILGDALLDRECRLFAVSTVRADFLDRFDHLPRLVEVRNRFARPWTLATIGAEGLREVIAGPARMAGLDVAEVEEPIIAEGRDEPGSLPLVQNALLWLWKKRTGNRLSGKLFTSQGGLAGILTHGADGLLASFEKSHADPALELLFRLVRVDVEGYRHTRRRIAFDQAIDIAGGGKQGQTIVSRLAGERVLDAETNDGPLRLITITEDPGDEATGGRRTRWVNLIHETLIRSKGTDDTGSQQPYWPTLWTYIERHKERSAWRERLRNDTREWLNNNKNPTYLWSHERVREALTALRQVGSYVHLEDDEATFLGPTDPPKMLSELTDPMTTHRRRALIGQRLDVFGDSRRGVGIDANGTPDICWHSVGPGEVTVVIGEKMTSDGTPAEITRRVEGFRMARYPVTVAQYRAFINAADGWHDSAWWGSDLLRVSNGDIYNFGPFGNYPAVRVSWFDAMAFCRWLGNRLRQNIRLPDEWEWQWASLGSSAAGCFPWRGGWDPEKEPHLANTVESGLGAVTAVGMYPGGASPEGVEDLAGTVFEMCLNKYHDPFESLSRKDDNRERALRGGSWLYDQEHARPGHRDCDRAAFRAEFLGFRIVSVP